MTSKSLTYNPEIFSPEKDARSASSSGLMTVIDGSPTSPGKAFKTSVTINALLSAGQLLNGAPGCAFTLSLNLLET